MCSNVDPSWYFRKPGGGPLYDGDGLCAARADEHPRPARRVTALSGTRIQEREFRGQLIPTDADDNTLILLDFGANLFALAYGTAAGSVAEGFSPSFFGTSGADRRAQAQRPAVRLPRQGNCRRGKARRRAVAAAARGRPAPHDRRASCLRGHCAAGRLGPRGQPSPVTAEHARHVIDIIESAYRSAATGQAQELTTTF